MELDPLDVKFMRVAEDDLRGREGFRRGSEGDQKGARRGPEGGQKGAGRGSEGGQKGATGRAPCNTAMTKKGRRPLLRALWCAVFHPPGYKCVGVTQRYE
eukprot:1175884-Prorocentrum_minimum.AAC.2